MQKISVEEFINQRNDTPLIDVRSPAEYSAGHIPGAYSMPLFTNAERKRVGITYKHEGQRTAIKLGLKIVGPKMSEIVNFAESLDSERIILHCWRGGMRSASVAWLLETVGFDVAVLTGGYKSYRRAMLDFFNKKLPIVLLGGKTGSGKTEILHAMAEEGEQVIDLEGLANHKGSAFGSFGLPPQPTTEQFQNELFFRFSHLDLNERIWLEDESSNIGKVGLPEGLWRQMCNAPIVVLDISLENRIKRLVRDYGKFPTVKLAASIEKIGKKLGGQHKKRALLSLEEGRLEEVAEILLAYYDKSYVFLEKKRNQIILARIDPGDAHPKIIAEQIINTEITYSV